MDNYKKAAKIIKEAEALIITAGAGMGVDSGLPDFRGNEGFWKAYPPIAKLGISFSNMANPYWFEEKPRLAWAFYGHRLNLYRDTIPHKGFSQLLEIGEKKKYKYFAFTSNVDGQFQKAGFLENRIEECHGSIHHFQCTSPCSYHIWNAKNEKVVVDEEIFEATADLPTCPKCKALARPNILMFGDGSWVSNRSEEQSDRFQDYLQFLKQNNIKTAIIEMGAGTAVPTVRFTSQRISRYLDMPYIRINPREYQISGNGISIPHGTIEGLERIFSEITLF